MQKLIEHKGTVLTVDDSLIRVSIINESACSACHAKSACGISDMKEKIIDIVNKNYSCNIGDSVIVSGEESIGWYALLYAYVLPFVIVLFTLFLSSAFFKNELYIGLISLLILIPYYFVIYLFRKRMKRVFSFVIKNVNI